jgi:MATE family multidrug resistance protein
VSAIAAYNVGVRILAFTSIPGLGLSVAAATLVAYALGAGDPESARRSGWQATRVGLVIAAVLGVLFIALRMHLARAFTDDAAVVRDLDSCCSGRFIWATGGALSARACRTSS